MQVFSCLKVMFKFFTLLEGQVERKIYSETGEAYSVTWLEKNLQVKYKDLIYFFLITGMPTKVCFRDMANYILSDS